MTCDLTPFGLCTYYYIYFQIFVTISDFKMYSFILIIYLFTFFIIIIIIFNDKIDQF